MVKPLATSSSIGGAMIARQPLRPLTSALNANVAEPDKQIKGDKPVKAFSVYSDSRKPASRGSNLPAQNQGIRRVEGNKRAAEPSSTFASRPTKSFRTADSTSRIRNIEPAMTKASIEALIAQKVDEKLAEKALQDAESSIPALSVELQKRLDDLEHRIDAKEEDGKSQGLQFLLMAKQHQMRGEDTSALRMYQLAQPFFPGNVKLQAKMKGVEDRIRAKKEESAKHVSAPVVLAPLSAPLSSLMAPLRAEKKSIKSKMVNMEEHEDDDDFVPAPVYDHEDSYASDNSLDNKPKAGRKPKKGSKKLPIFRDTSNGPTNPSELTPRTTQLLRIINSRDVNQIKALKGVGSKKADNIINCLVEMDDDEIYDLESLASLKGVGGKTVENMRMGLNIAVGYDF